MGPWGLGFLKMPNLGFGTLSLGEGCFLDPGRLQPGWWEGTQASGKGWQGAAHQRTTSGMSRAGLGSDVLAGTCTLSPWLSLGLPLACSFSCQLSLRVQSTRVPGAEAAPHMITNQACPLQSHRGN